MDMNQERYYAQSYEGFKSFMYRVFGWMAFALTLSAATAYYIASAPAILMAISRNPLLLIGLIVLQFGLVIGLSVAITRLSSATAFIMFALYAGITGITIAPIFFAFTQASIVSTFLVTAGMFGAMAVYGAVTRADLTFMGTFMGLALFGIIIAQLVNLFVKSEGFNVVIAMIGVVVFAGLTAFDVQKLKEFASRFETDSPLGANMAILGALQLYLDFLNMFLFLLQIMGERRER